MDGFASYDINRNRMLVRQKLTEVKRRIRADDNTVRNEALDYLDGKSHSLLLEKIKKRWGMGIRKDTWNEDGRTYETYSYKDFQIAVDSGFYETVTTNTLRRLVNARATLFNQPTQYWQYYTGEGDAVADAEDVAQMIEAHRKAGQAKIGMIRADRISNLLQVGGLLLGWRSGHLTYTPVAPQCVYIGFGSTLIEDGKRVVVDQRDIEDASVISFLISDGGGDESSASRDHLYYAYIGRCDGYDRGRAVKYRARNWYDIPEPGMNGVVEEYEDTTGIGNPLTIAQNYNPELIPYEYPVVFFVGDDFGTDRILPDTDQGLDLYYNVIELDMAWSRLLKAALKCVVGDRYIKNPSNLPLPRSIEGTVELKENQEIIPQYGDSAAVQAARDAIRDIARTIAEGAEVPGHTVVSDDTTDEQSGVALTIRYKPLLDMRRERSTLNEAAVERLFRVELSLLAHHDDKWNQIPRDVQLAWDPGQMEIPRDPLEELNRLSLELEKGIIDLPELIRQYYSLSTINDAVQLLQAISDRKEEYAELLSAISPKPSAPEQPQQTGALGALARIRAMRQQGGGQGGEEQTE